MTSMEQLEALLLSLSYLQPTTKRVESGYVAIASLNLSGMSAYQVDALLMCLTGSISQAGDKFISPVSDNNQLPIIFDSEDEALGQARQRVASLSKQFIYGAYDIFGVALEVKSTPQVFFVRKNKAGMELK